MNSSHSHGIVVLDKPAGISSNKALAELRAKGKVGHAGTLDPFATGVLVALLGDATRLSSLAMALPKTYRATVLFGRETDTLDTEGVVVAECDPGEPRALDGALAALTGKIEQVPPAFSALKVDGRRAYRLARQGEAPALDARVVEVHSIEVIENTWPQVKLEVACGAGTYLRALARDLGRAIGLPASLCGLRRTAVGPYRAEDADAGFVRPALELAAAAGLPSAVLNSAEDALRYVSGRPVDQPTAARVAVVFRGAMIGLGVGREDRLYPECVFAGARREIETFPL